METLNERIFTDKDGRFTPGWRTTDVRVGEYLPPQHQNIKELLEGMGKKVGDLELVVLGAGSGEIQKLAAWVMLTILRIHPRSDGNGRLAKAAVEQLVPSRKLSGVYFPSWHAIEKISIANMMEKVSQANGQPIPDLLARLNRNFGSHDKDELDKTVSQFYRWSGRDWVTEVLKQEIDQLTADEQGVLGPDQVMRDRALMGMNVLINEAPKRPPRPVSAQTSLSQRVGRFIRKIF